MKIINFFLLIFLILGCNENYNQKKTETSSSIIKWNVNDEPPSIKLCDEIGSEFERDICFKEKLTELIYNNIDFSKIVVENNLNDTLIISILINKGGKISLLKSFIPKKIRNQIPIIDTIILKAINNLPNILPATKTNIGVQVSSSFTLPIILKTK
jgi:hypothetical protein|tara:strand:- start:2090 stop:2557 length:468 start_codon:yes stop_codon:yes gene_type:complete